MPKIEHIFMIKTRLDKVCTIIGSMVPVGLVVGNAAFEGIISLVGIIWIVNISINKINPLKNLIKNPLVIPWIMWFAFIVISLCYNGPGNKGIIHDLAFIRYLIYSFALLDISERQPISRYFLIGLALAVFFAALNTIMAYGIGFDMLGRPIERYIGKLKQAEMISGIAAYSSPFFLGWGISDKKLSKTERSFIILVGIISFIQIIQTGIRTGILACISGILFIFLYNIIKNRSFKILAVLFVIFIFSGTIFYFNKEKLTNLESMYYRIYYWKVVIKIWQDNKILGVGISKYQDVYKETEAKKLVGPVISSDGREFKESETSHAHNLILMLLVCTGLAGLSSFLWLFINSIILIIKKHDKWRNGLISFPIVLLVAGLTGYNIYHSWYQALFAYFIVLIGTNDEWENFYSTSNASGT